MFTARLLGLLIAFTLSRGVIAQCSVWDQGIGSGANALNDYPVALTSCFLLPREDFMLLQRLADES